jgi:hypothetical protein
LIGILSPYTSAQADLFAVTDRGAVYRSTNNGVAWGVQGDIPEAETVGLTPGLTSGTLFALGKTGSVYQSASSGALWSAAGNVGASDCVSIAIARSGALFALTSSGDVSRSTNSGATWTRESNVGASDCVALAVGGWGGVNDTLFVAAASGDVARLPSGTAWTTVGSTGFTPVVDLLWVSATLYALTDAGEILRSSNAGATWSAIGTISQVGMRDLAYVGGKFKAISQEGEVYESTTGSSWPTTWIGTTNQVLTVAFAPGVPEFRTGIDILPGPPAPPSLRAFPSAFSTSTVLRFSVSQPGRAVLRVYDVSGRLVATPLERLVPAGGQEVPWDGTSGRGGAVGSGVYFAELEVGGIRATTRMTLLR